MTRIICSTVLLLILVGLGFSQNSKPKKITIKGAVVAESFSNRFMSCYHVCRLLLVVRLDVPGSEQFAIISVAFMDDRGIKEKGEQWKLIERPREWKFTAAENDPVQQELKEFSTTLDMTTGNDTTAMTKIKEWLPVEGAESVILPFGRSIPSYLVDVGQYRTIN